MGSLIDAEKLKYRLEKRIDESNNEEFINGLLEAQVEVDSSETKDIVLCKDCKHCFVDGENVRFNCCELNHNKVQSDDWFCADGERGEANE